MKAFHAFSHGNALVLTLVLSSLAFSVENGEIHRQLQIRYVPTPDDSVQAMLWMARVGKEDIVYDLGSGDGRIVIAAVRDFGAQRAVGVESDPDLVRQSRKNAEEAGVADRVEFIEGDLFDCDFSEATVVTLFLGHGANIELRPKLFRLLKPGSRVVSNQFGMGEWKPNKSLRLYRNVIGMRGRLESVYQYNHDVPSYGGYGVGMYDRGRINMWFIPVSLAGHWSGTLETSRGPVNLEMSLHQTVAEVVGTFSIPEHPEWKGRLQFDVWEDEVRWFCMQQDANYYAFNLYFKGNLQGDRMEGTIKITEADETTEVHWAGTRSVTPYTGTWQWQHDDGDNRPLTLRIEQVGTESIATLTSRDEVLPVADFYDFRGGFYFTYFFGSNTDSISEDSGWLIGSSGMIGSELKGGISFYPYKEKVNGWNLPLAGAGRAFKVWEPVLLEP